MARAIWSGAISFGLVSVPVRLYSAIQQKDVSFHQFKEGTGERIRYKRVSAESGEEVPYEDIVKGYEVDDGRYVMISPEELESIEPEKTRAIEIEDFVEMVEIDPAFYDRTYYLAPGSEQHAQKAYALLHRAMTDTGKVGIGRFVMRTKEYLAAIRPAGQGLVLETMYFADEIREAKEIDGLPVEVEPAERELEMAEGLIESLTSSWQPDRYRDTYRERVLELVQRKEKGEEVVTERARPEEEGVVDLMEALERSMEAVKERRGEGNGKSSRKAG